MRRKSEAVLPFTWNDQQLPKTVREHREKYKGISRVLDDQPAILDRVHRDLRKLSQGHGGRSGDFTSETILRTMIVHAIEGLSLRETVIRMAESDFFQDFVRTRKKAAMDHSFLGKCLKAVEPETWKQVNQRLTIQAVERRQVDPDIIRTDTTAVETNIHWPTDASLLWDTYRVAARIVRRGREIDPDSCPHRFHERKLKKLYLYITRYSKSKSKKRLRQVKGAFGTLIERVDRIVDNARHFCKYATLGGNLELRGVAQELQAYLPAMTDVVACAYRAQVEGEKVPARERVFSIFEPHTELIMRGRAQKPVEFGHMVLLCQSPEKFITDYEVYEERVVDGKLTEAVIDRHEQLFGRTPEVLAGDMGFCPEKTKYAELEERVGTLAIPKRLRDFADVAMSVWQAFRAGIEGTISGLKRAFRLARCHYRGFKSFTASVGLGVFSHNLVVLANAEVT